MNAGNQSMTEPAQPVSVIIPAYNSAAFIERAIRSVLQQTWQPLEILVIDDGSTDNTREVVQAIEGPIRYIRQENAGASAARNRGIQEAKGDFIAFLDSDDEWLPRRLERTLAPLLANPALGFCYCHSSRIYLDGSSRLHHAESVKRRFPGGIYSPPYAHTSASTFRRECFDRCGEFDTSMCRIEDIDLFVRIAEVYPTHLVPEVLVRIHHRPGSLSGESDAEQGSRLHFQYVCKALGRARVPRDRDAALAAAYFSAGIYHLDAWLNGPARRYFLASFLLRPSWRSLQFALRTLIPKFIVILARRIRDRNR